MFPVPMGHALSTDEQTATEQALQKSEPDIKNSTSDDADIRKTPP